jgi:hypothetical protein
LIEKDLVVRFDDERKNFTVMPWYPPADRAAAKVENVGAGARLLAATPTPKFSGEVFDVKDMRLALPTPLPTLPPIR